MTILDEIYAAPRPDQLYHYTSYAGFLGIASSKAIWASSIHHLNDAQEFAHGLFLARTEIEGRRRLARSTTEDEFLATLDVRLQQIRRVHVFVASFSEVNDLLSQWRGYCPVGRGVSVGFDSATLRDHAKRQGFRLVPAVYEYDRQSALVRELTDMAIAKWISEPAEAERVTFWYGYTMAVVSPLLKSPAFSEEREWRLVSLITGSDHPQVHVREGQARIVPYFEFSLALPNQTLVIKDICVGPTPDPDLAMNGIATALQVKKVQANALTFSSVPFRAW